MVAKTKRATDDYAFSEQCPAVCGISSEAPSLREVAGMLAKDLGYREGQRVRVKLIVEAPEARSDRLRLDSEEYY